MEFMSMYGLFLAKIVTIAAAVGTLIFVVFSFGQRNSEHRGKLSLIDLGEQYKEMQREMQLSRMSDVEQKNWHKEFKKKQKAEQKLKKQQAKSGTMVAAKPCLYVLDFDGSVDAHEVTSLREEISAVLAVAKVEDQVLLRLESAGGVVHGYGLAASQLTRLRHANIRLTVVVDKIAASGGYMMACVADRIVSAPFAIIGSVGVVAQIPNFHRLLQKNNVDIELHTAGEFKRTLTLLGENTEQGREKFREELNETHLLFKQFVQQQRPSLDIDAVATGEHWFGTQAKEKGLVDAIGTSDDLLISEMDKYEVFGVVYKHRKRLIDRITESITQSADRLLLRWWQRSGKPLM
ncbi:protease SohB [Candidatus Fukatsuia endosymbiont of Tuberolachnus salignus]|uniref:protease SohB n=1 Tax=Candidatus Fukatsuia endosymbiont of Tuberolachnus salignus TaxID=3077957 RepID=UPI00313E3947